MDPIGVLSRALDQTGDLLDHVDADVLERPTPCTEWDVSALADHVINDSQQFLLMVCICSGPAVHMMARNIARAESNDAAPSAGTRSK